MVEHGSIVDFGVTVVMVVRRRRRMVVVVEGILGRIFFRVLVFRDLCSWG